MTHRFSTAKSPNLTGRLRYRAQPLSPFDRRVVLILQVEEQHPEGPPDANGMPQFLAAAFWRDAMVEDLSDPDFPHPRKA